NIPQNFKLAFQYLKQVADQYWPTDTSVTDPLSPNQKLANFAGQAAGILGQMYWRGEGDNAASYNGLGLMHLEGLKHNDKDIVPEVIDPTLSG
ncbi:8297_t:CDS:2, partial [Racocetra persica]